MNSTNSAALFRIVASHYLFSALCFVVLSVLILFSSTDFFGHYFHPHLLAITHMAALGWATTIIFGASYQLLPVIFETRLYSERLPWLGFLLLITGTLMLVYSFWIFDPGPLMQLASFLLLAAVIIFSLILFKTAKNGPNTGGIFKEFIVSSCVWLVATAALGMLLVFNFTYAFLPKDHLQFLRLHAHIGIGGWFLLLIIGVSAKLVPMFLVSRKQDENLLVWTYYLINGALILFLIDTYVNNLNSKTYAIAAVAVSGVILYFLYLLKCFRSRLKNRIELPITNSIISFVFLGLSVLVAPIIIYQFIDKDPMLMIYTNIYGFMLFMGWISSLILGQTFKTLPFIVWTRKYENLAGKVKTPMPGDLYKRTLLKAQTLSYIAFCLTFLTGMITRMHLLIYTGFVFLMITSITYTINVFIIIFHKIKIPS